MRNPYKKFQNSSNSKTVAFTVLKLCYASKSVTNGRTDGQTDRRTDGCTNNPEAICPSNFFEVGGIIKVKMQFLAPDKVLFFFNHFFLFLHENINAGTH